MSTEPLRMGPLFVDPARHTVEVEPDGAIDVTRTEFAMLLALMATRGTPVSREALLDRVWSPTKDITQHAIDNHIGSLRRKLGMWGEMIDTVRGVGYRIVDLGERGRS